MKIILKFLISVIVLVVVWSAMMSIDSKRTEENKLPLFAIDVVTNEYENGKITQYISIGYKVVEYQLENKNNVLEFQNSFFVPDTENLVDKYLEEKHAESEEQNQEDAQNKEEKNNADKQVVEESKDKKEDSDKENKGNSTNDTTEEGTYTVTHY